MTFQLDKMKVCGILSGTSVDGISACIVDINEVGKDDDIRYSMKLIEFVCANWRDEEKSAIFHLMNANNATTRDFCRTNVDIGKRFASVINEMKNKDEIELIGSHGQTIWHEVEDSKVHSTLQIGESAAIALETGIDVISDFRVGDVSVGGAGAPLTSTFDYLVLRHDSKWRAIQNIGGIGNVTFVPPRDSDSPVISFDTGPGNVLLDEIMRIVTHGKEEFDKDGVFAKSGRVNPELLENLMSHSYFVQSPPKTTGRELFGKKFAHRLYDEAKILGISDQDIISTVLQFTVDSIGYSYTKFGPPKLDEIILSGGGLSNLEMFYRFSSRMKFLGINAKIMSHSDLEELGHHPDASDAKEAMLFAFLAYLHVKNRYSNIPSVTGAKKRVILGKKTLALSSQ